MTLITILAAWELYPRSSPNCRTYFDIPKPPLRHISYINYHNYPFYQLNSKNLVATISNLSATNTKVPLWSYARQRVVAPAPLRCFRAPVAPDVLLPWRGTADASLSYVTLTRLRSVGCPRIMPLFNCLSWNFKSGPACNLGQWRLRSFSLTRGTESFNFFFLLQGINKLVLALSLDFDI